MQTIEPYWQDEERGLVIYNNRCEDVLPLLNGVDLVFTSPPYNLALKPKTVTKWSACSLINGYEEHKDDLQAGAYVEWQHEALRLCWNCLSEKGAIYYNHKPKMLSGRTVLPLEYNPGLPLRQIIIWPRSGGINFNVAFYCPTHEWIMVLAKEAFRLKSQGASGVGDTWHGIPQEANEHHPAPFPVALPARAIETVAPSLVVDPFMGIGSTLIAAKLAGVAAVGIDTSERYCERAARRLENTPVLPFPESAPPEAVQLDAFGLSEKPLP